MFIMNGSAVGISREIENVKKNWMITSMEKCNFWNKNSGDNIKMGVI